MKKRIILEFDESDNSIELVKGSDGYRCIAIGGKVVELKSDDQVRELIEELEELE